MVQSPSTEQRTDPDIEAAREDFRISREVHKAEALDQASTIMAAYIQHRDLEFIHKELSPAENIGKSTLKLARMFEEYLSS